MFLHYATQGPGLNQDVSGQQAPLLLLDMPILQGPELHLDFFRQKEPKLLLEVNTAQVPELHLEVFRQKKPLLLLDVSTLPYRSLSCTGLVLTTGAYAAPGGDYTTGT